MEPIDLPLLGQRLFNVPLLLTPDKGELIAAAMLDHLGIKQLTRAGGETVNIVQLRQEASDATSRDRQTRRAYEVIDRVAIIPIQGSLVQRLSGLDPFSGMTGYTQIDHKLSLAMQDDAVGAILLDVDSPGGEVSGCFDLARRISANSARNSGKPIIGAANEMACSAGYALISACDEIYMADTGRVGSIGVITMMADYTRSLDKSGIEVTIIRGGERKARGGPYERADNATVTKLQNWIDDTRDQFCKLVADNRKLSVASIKAQEADWYFGSSAMDHGLIDGTGSFAAIFDRARALAW